MLKRIFLFLMLLLARGLGAEPLPVSAIEYPPFTTQAQADYGSAFTLLTRALDGSGLTPYPQFLPPARAHKMVREGRWCASFYPPATPVASHEVMVALDHTLIYLGLYRKSEPSPFVWRSLQAFEGKRIAKLRAVLRDGIGLDLEQAGAILLDVETFAQGLQLLEMGRVDFVFGDSVSGPLLMERLGLNGADYQFSSSIFESVPTRVWLNLTCPAAKRAFAVLQ